MEVLTGMLASEMRGGNLGMICKDRLTITSVYLSIPYHLTFNVQETSKTWTDGAFYREFS
jgi:hypothetical protein